MAAILRRQARDEAWTPDRPEALPRRRPGQEGEQRIDEERPAVAVDTEIVNVEIAGRVSELRHIKAIIAVMDLARLERILESPELIERRHPERLAIGPQTH